MNPLQLAVKVGRLLDELDIGYAVGGSVASSLFGEPRATLDIDVALRGSEPNLLRLIDRASADFYVPTEAAQARGDTVEVRIEVIYNSNGVRPDAYSVTWWENGIQQPVSGNPIPNVLVKLGAEIQHDWCRSGAFSSG